MSGNIEKLGNVIMEQILTVNRSNSKTVMEFGSINSAMALMPDHSPGPIPEGEYTVSRNAVPAIKKGARVLVAWCGGEPVVVDAVS
jgi:hypothetical protein